MKNKKDDPKAENSAAKNYLLSSLRQKEIDEEHNDLMQEIDKISMNEPQILEINVQGKKVPEDQSSNETSKDTQSKKDKKNKKSKSKKNKDGSIPEEEQTNEERAPTSTSTGLLPNQEKNEEVESTKQEKEKEKQKKEQQKRAEQQRLEKRQLQQQLEKVEEKLKSREQFQIQVCSITLTKLKRVHKLRKNQPWIKANYGMEYEWIADYRPFEELEPTLNLQLDGDPESLQAESEVDLMGKKKAIKDGNMAFWQGLQWTFRLERNERDRQDLVFAICSKDLIMGRYILRKEEFSEIPESNSGFFSMSGEVVNDLGKVGNIQLICQKVAIDKQANKALTSKADLLRKQLEADQLDLTTSTKQEERGVSEQKREDSQLDGKQTTADIALAHWKYQHISIRILSMAVMDLKPVHFLEANSPSIVVESGEWMGMTQPQKNAGIAAAWRKLHWKIAIDRDSGLSIFVNSQMKLIGKVYLPAEELCALQPQESREILSMIKYLSYGSEMTGKLKMNVVINHPEDIIEMPLVAKPGRVSPLNEDMLPEGSLEKQSLAGLDPSTFLASSSLLANPNTSQWQQGPVLRVVPFNLLIQEVFCLDIQLPKSPLTLLPFAGSPAVKLQMACRTWSAYTEATEARGGYAHWIGLKWKIPVLTTQSAVRATLWSVRGRKSLGRAVIPIEELLTIPCDRSRKADLYTKIVNDQGEIISKIRLTCRFEENLEAVQELLKTKGGLDGSNIGLTSASGEIAEEERMMMLDDLRGSRQHSPFGTPINSRPSSPNHLLHPSQSHSRPTSPGKPSGGVAAGVGSKVDSYPLPTRLEYPIQAMIRKIMIFDLPSVHHFSKNSPVVTFQFDRASVETSVAEQAGGSATWDNIEWHLRIREDSLLRFTVTSKQTLIGMVQIAPQKLLKAPMNLHGVIELVVDLYANPVQDQTADSKAVNRSLSLIPKGKLRVQFAINLEQQRQQQLLHVEYTRDPETGIILGEQSELPMYQITGQDNNNNNQRLSPGGNNRKRRDSSGNSTLPTRDINRGGYGSRPSSPPGLIGSNGTPYYYSDDPYQMTNTTSLPQITSIFDPNLPESSLQQPVLFDPNMLFSKESQQQIHFRLTIQEIDVWDLPAMHTLSKNSPQVLAACGRWSGSTEVLDNAGGQGYWTNVQWQFVLVDRTTRLRLKVVSRGKEIGNVYLSVSQLVEAKTENDLIKRVTRPILVGRSATDRPESSGGGEKRGRLKITFKMEAIRAADKPIKSRPNSSMNPPGVSSASFSRSYDPTSDNYQNNHPHHSFNQSLSLLNQRLDPFSNPFPIPNLSFPLTLQLVEIKIYDFTPVIQLGSSTISLRLHCENFYQSIDQHLLDYGMMLFPNLQWLIYFPREDIVLKLVLLQKGHEIAELRVPVAEVVQESVVLDPQGLYRSAIQVLRKPVTGQELGKLQFFFYTAIGNQTSSSLTNQTTTMMSDQNNNPRPVSSNPGNHREDSLLQLQTESHDTDFRFALPTQQTQLSQQSQRHPNTLSPKQPPSSASTNNNNRPLSSQPRPGNVSNRGGRPESAGIYIDDDDEEDDHEIDVEPEVDRRGVGIGVGGEVGKGLVFPSVYTNNTTSMLSNQTPLQPQQSLQRPRSHQEIYNNRQSQQQIAQQLSRPLSSLPQHSSTSYLSLPSLQPPASVSPSQRSPLLQQQQPQANQSRLLTSQSSQLLPSNLSMNASVLTSDSAALGGGYTSDVIEQAIEIKLVAMAAIDLPSVHRFKANSPVASIACGKFTATTKAMEKSGNTAAWEDLNFKFACAKRSQVRVLVSSDDQLIGVCNFSRPRLMNGVFSEHGFYVAFGDLKNSDGKDCGKIKLVYEMVIPESSQ